MVPDIFETFFLASAGTGAAFIGLLFVALSIHPQLVFAHPAAESVPRQLLTEATLVLLGNGFVVSSVALLPTINVGWVAMVLGLWGVLWAARIIILLDRAHQHHPVSWHHRLRVTSVSVVAVALYAAEAGLGLVLVCKSGTVWAVSGLGVIILALYVIGMARAWILLGDPRQGWSGWLNPLEDRVEEQLVRADGTERGVPVLPPHTMRMHPRRRLQDRTAGRPSG